MLCIENIGRPRIVCGIDSACKGRICRIVGNLFFPIYLIPQQFYCFVLIFFHIRHKCADIVLLLYRIHVFPCVIGPERHSPAVQPLAGGIDRRIFPCIFDAEYNHVPSGMVPVIHDFRGYIDIRIIPVIGLGLIPAVFVQLSNPTCNDFHGRIEADAVGKQVIEHDIVLPRGGYTQILQILETFLILYPIAVICGQEIIHQHTAVGYIIGCLSFLKRPGLFPESVQYGVCIAAHR